MGSMPCLGEEEGLLALRCRSLFTPKKECQPHQPKPSLLGAGVVVSAGIGRRASQTQTACPKVGRKH